VLDDCLSLLFFGCEQFVYFSPTNRPNNTGVLTASDPFVEIEMKDANHKSIGKKHKTAVIDETLNPTWQQTFEFDVTPQVAYIEVIEHD
jgi:hypothetical protein